MLAKYTEHCFTHAWSVDKVTSNTALQTTLFQKQALRLSFPLGKCENLAKLARELTDSLHKSVSVDWNSARARYSGSLLACPDVRA